MLHRRLLQPTQPICGSLGLMQLLDDKIKDHMVNGSQNSYGSMWCAHPHLIPIYWQCIWPLCCMLTLWQWFFFQISESHLQIIDKVQRIFFVSLRMLHCRLLQPTKPLCGCCIVDYCILNKYTTNLVHTYNSKAMANWKKRHEAHAVTANNLKCCQHLWRDPNKRSSALHMTPP